MCSGTVGAAPSHPTETLSPPCVHRSKRASSTSRSGSGHVGAERCLHPTLPRGQQTCPRAEEGGGTPGNRYGPCWEKRQKRGYVGRNLRGSSPFQCPFPKCSSSRCCLQGGCPVAHTYPRHHLQMSGIPGANPAASICQRRGSAPGQGHRRRASGLLAPPHFYRSPVSL